MLSGPVPTGPGQEGHVAPAHLVVYVAGEAALEVHVWVTVMHLLIVR